MEEKALSVWLTIPSARPASEIAERLGKWKAMGYKIALLRNGPRAYDELPVDWVMITGRISRLGGIDKSHYFGCR